MGADATPQRVIGRRIGAAFIDMIPFWAAFWLVFLLVADSTSSDADLGSPNLKITVNDTVHYLAGSEASLFLLVWVAAAFLWFGVLPGITGWTPGKLVTGLRVVGADGNGVGVKRNLQRALAWVVDGFPYVLPGLVGFIALLANKGRRVADLWADTYVVKAADQGRPVAVESPTPTRHQPAAGWYQDPEGKGRRWWDGAAWTEHRS